MSYDDVFDFLKKNFEERTVDSGRFPYFDVPYEISSDSFKTFGESGKEKEVFFIDGGSNIVAQKQNKVVSLVNAGYSFFRGKSLIAFQVFRFMVFVKLIDVHRSNFTVHISSKFLGDERKAMKDFEFFEQREFDLKLKLDSSNEISKAVDVFRRLLELKITKLVSKRAVAVLDGSLDWKFDEEGEIISEMDNVFALSKKTSLITEETIGFDSFFNSVCKMDGACYAKIGEMRNPRYESYSVRFFRNMFFRFDSVNSKNIEDVLSFLKFHSRDGVVYGYPFGLYHIDSIARVTNEDARFYKTLLDMKHANNSIRDLHDDFNTVYD